MTAVILFAGLGFFHHVSTLPGPLHGDEIHYLVMTVSLLRDRDLNLVNNYDSPEVKQLFRGSVEPHLIYRKDDRGYSSHEPGLPAMLVLPYALGGRRGVVGFMTLLGVIAAMQVFFMAKAANTSDRNTALVTFATAFNVPFAMMSGKAFPDMAGAAFLAVACRWMLMDQRRSRHLAGALTAAMLPWIHVKFIVFAGLLPLAFLMSDRRKCREIPQLMLPLLISIAGLALFYRNLFGDFLYVVRVRAGGMGNPYPGIAGLLFDREAGLLVFAPVFIPAVLYMLTVWRNRIVHPVITLIPLAFWIIAGSWIDWHSGHCPPARYLVPLMPFLGVFSTGVFRKPESRFRISVWALLCGVSLAQLVGVAVSIPETAIVHNDGINRLWDMFLPAGMQWTVPSWLNPGPGLWWSFAGMLAATAAAALIFLPPVRKRSLRLVSIPVLMLAGSLVVAGWITESDYHERLAATPLPDKGPGLMAPDDGTVWYGTFPDLEWEPLEGADGYIYVIELPDGRRLVIPRYGSTKVHLADSIVEILPLGRYCWQVIPIKANRHGVPSDRRCFQLAP